MLLLLATFIDAAHATDRSIRVVARTWEATAVVPEPTVPAGSYDGRPCWVRLSAHGGVLRASPSNCPPELMGAGALWASHWQVSSLGRITTSDVLDVGFRPQKTGVGVELFVLPLAANLRVVATPADVLRVYSAKECGRGPPMSGGGMMGVPMCRVTIRVDERGVASLGDQVDCTQSAAELTAPYVLGQSFRFDRGFRPRTGVGTAKPGFAVGFARAAAVRSSNPSSPASALGSPRAPPRRTRTC